MTSTDEPIAPPEGAEPRESPAQAAIHALADVTLAPVEPLRGKPTWLRAALLCHLGSTLAATLVAFRQGLPDWQLYAWMGLATVILVANFMRWRRRAGWLRRILSTLAAVTVTLGWAVLLFDRARVDVLPEAVPGGPRPVWFGLAVALLVLCAASLVAHLFASPPARRGPPSGSR